jgi:hypothetical protein
MTHFPQNFAKLRVIDGWLSGLELKVLRSLSMSRFDRSSERGAILIQVAVALLGLTVFSAFVLDYGVLWSARGQAQNAADAGAMGAAVNLMWNRCGRRCRTETGERKRRLG